MYYFSTWEKKFLSIFFYLPKILWFLFFQEKHERHAFSFVPFSAGERNCIGQKLANQEALMIMAVMLKNFTIESPNLDQVKMGLDALLTPIHLKLCFKPIVNN